MIPLRGDYECTNAGLLGRTTRESYGTLEQATGSFPTRHRRYSDCLEDPRADARYRSGARLHHYRGSRPLAEGLADCPLPRHEPIAGALDIARSRRSTSSRESARPSNAASAIVTAAFGSLFAPVFVTPALNIGLNQIGSLNSGSGHWQLVPTWLTIRRPVRRMRRLIRPPCRNQPSQKVELTCRGCGKSRCHLKSLALRGVWVRLPLRALNLCAFDRKPRRAVLVV